MRGVTHEANHTRRIRRMHRIGPGAARRCLGGQQPRTLGPVAKAAEVGLARRWYLPQLERLHDDSEARSADINNLECMAAGYADRERFLTELTLDPPDATSDQSGRPGRDEYYLILSTIHSPKGQERKAVFLLRAVDGCIPSDLGIGSTSEID